MSLNMEFSTHNIAVIIRIDQTFVYADLNEFDNKVSSQICVVMLFCGAKEHRFALERFSFFAK